LAAGLGGRAIPERAVSSHTFCLSIDELAGGAVVGLPPAPVRAIYVASGAARIEDHRSTAALAENSAWHGPGEATIATTGGATLLRWELISGGGDPPELRGENMSSRVALTTHVELEGNEYLLRCDRVDFPPGGTALLHTHQGPGIRCLLKGGIRIDTGGTTHRYGPFEGWFESGPEPVFAATSETEPSAFARMMILPAELRGKSSIRYVNPEDQAKPKAQRYQVFIDRPIQI
jgi:hypothetical protein